MLRVVFACFLAVTTLMSAPGRADQNDPRLDELFGQLQIAESPHAARMLESVIWQVWLESGSDTVDLLMGQAMAAMSEERHGQALELLDSVVVLKPDYAEGWNKRATLYYVIGRLDDSLADVERTLALEPRHFGALAGMGLIYGQLDDDARALEAYERALQVNPHLMHAKQKIRELQKAVRGQKT